GTFVHLADGARPLRRVPAVRGRHQGVNVTFTVWGTPSPRSTRSCQGPSPCGRVSIVNRYWLMNGMKSKKPELMGGIFTAGISAPGCPLASSRATKRRAGRSQIPALAPVSAKRTGSGTLCSQRVLPSLAIGNRKPVQDTTTRTWKLPWLWLPLESVAVQLTVVEPSGNWAPDGGTQLTVGCGSTLSVAVAL